MALQVSRVKLWAAGVDDRPGALAEQLVALAGAGANLEFILARRSPERPGTGVVFLAPLTGPVQIRAARKAGFLKAASLKAIRIVGPDRPGVAGRLAEALAAADINLRGMSAGVIGRRFVAYLAVDSAADAAKAVRLLRRQ